MRSGGGILILGRLPYPCSEAGSWASSRARKAGYEAEPLKVLDNSGVIRIEVEETVGGSSRISDIDTRNATGNERSSDFSPSLIEILMHIIIG